MDRLNDTTQGWRVASNSERLNGLTPEANKGNQANQQA